MTPDRKLFAGARLRRLRLQLALTQTRMADDLGVSVSYLNLIERNQRPLSAAFLLKLANVYNLDLRQLTGDDADAVTSELAAVFADPLLGGLEVSRAELGEVAASAPGVAQALLRLYAARGTAAPDHAAATGPVEAMTELLLERRNHFPDLDAAAERLADDLRLAAGDLTAALAERLRVRHGLTVRTLPSAVMPDLLRRLDLHARQLQLSEGLDAASRTFAIAYQVALIELKPEIDAVIATAALPSAAHQRFALQTLANYAAAAVMMPYARFHAAAEALGYDLELLQARFGAGFEQVAHRLTTLQRPGMRGVPFLMIRTDRAGNVSKRFSAVRSALASDGGGCPLWVLHAAFDRPGRIMRQVVETEDGQRYLSVARTVRTYATAYGTVKPEFTISAPGLYRGRAAATPIGLGCARCGRTACRQRSLVPAGARLSVDERSRGVTPFRFISPGES
jgi:predicted transcriptional regulator/DNA-binding XRE family transcriptional regulator